MAAVERSGGGPPPDPFTGIMKDAGFRSMELSGFSGDMSTKINKWHARGLGKAIGFPLFDKAGHTRTGEFRGVMFALPLVDTDKPDIYQSALVVIPTETSCRFAIIAPKKSAYNGEAARKSEEANHARDFHAIFSPSKDPYFPNSWGPQNAKEMANDFFRNPAVLDPSIDVRYVIPTAEVRPFLERALESAEIIAKRNEERERVRNLPADEASFEAIVGPAVSGDLDLLNEFLLRASDRQREQTEQVGDVLASIENDLLADLERGLNVVDPGNE